MRNRGYVIIGAVLVLLGLSVLLNQLTGFDLCSLWLPILLIAFGVMILLRPRLAAAGTEVTARPLGDVRRRGQWITADEEIWLLVGDITLDFTEAVLPLDKITIRSYGFVNGIRVVVPEGVGVAVSSTAFLTTVRMLDVKHDTFLAPVTYQTPDFDTAAKKVLIETLHFVADVRVKRA